MDDNILYFAIDIKNGNVKRKFHYNEVGKCEIKVSLWKKIHI